MMTRTRHVCLAAMVFLAVAFAALNFSRAAGADEADLRKVLGAQKEMQDLIARTMPAFLKVGGGCGVIISEDGYFITNYHVAVEAFRQTETIAVIGSDGAHYAAKKIGWDPLGDLTLCKIELKEGEKAPCLELGDSDAATIGQMVLVYGNPFSLSNDSKPSIAFGIISAKRRYMATTNLGNSFLYVDALQTDAPLNPGNSGGPMISLDGKVLGINGLIFMRYGFKASTGLGFAVSANQIKKFIPLLKTNEVVYHGAISGWYFDYPVGQIGAHVQRVDDGGGAAAWGFKAGDLITKINDEPVPTVGHLLRVITSNPEQTEFKITALRDGKEVVLTGKTERIPWAPGQMSGLELPPQQQQKQDADRAVLGVVFDDQFAGPGAKVKAVTPDSGAAKAGIATGDIITKVDGGPMANFAAVIGHIKSKKAGDTVKITVTRDGAEKTFDVVLMKYSEIQKPAPPPLLPDPYTP